MKKENSGTNIGYLTQLALFAAIIFVMGFTPLGSLPLGGPIVATLVQIPVVIGAVLLGVKAGMMLGGVFGLVSLLVFSIYGYPGAFLFSPLYSFQLAEGNTLLGIGYALASLFICFVPRILIGLAAGFVFNFVEGKTKSTAKAAAAAGVAGSLTNTVLVLSGILLFFAQPYAQLGGKVIWVLLGTSVLVNGIPEAVVTPILTVAVTLPLLKMRKSA